MIDIEKAKKEFKKYISNYNPQDKQIALKISHIENVTNVAKKLALQLNLEKEDVELAELIALLHDIGRFEQIKRYHTFMDKDSINHGEFGYNLLKEGLIRSFIEDDKYDNIILNAVLNHNKDKIDDNLSEREILHCKIVRDADKLDIYRLLLEQPIEVSYNGCKDMENDKVSKVIFNEYMNERKIIYTNINTYADNVVAHIAYVFDFYFDYSLNVVKQNNYIDKIIKKMNFKNVDTVEKFIAIQRVAEEYIDSCIKIKE